MSDVDDLLWKVTEADIRCKLKLKLGLIQAKSAQDYQIMSNILVSAFGGETKQKVTPPKNYKEAVEAFSAVFG